MNLFVKYASIIAFSFLVWVPGSMKGQSNDAAIKALEAQLYEFAQAYSTLPQTKNKESVLKFFSKNVTSNIFYFGVTGRARTKNDNYQGFASYLDNIIRSPSIEIKYEITEIVGTRINGDVATTVYMVEYETKEENGIWVKGKETVTMAMEKSGDKWKAVHYTIMGLEDEKLKGTCLCELFISEANDGEVVSKTTVPSGQGYSTKFDNFEFRTVDGNWNIKVQDKFFRRLKSGALISLGEDGEVQMGAANSKRETVLKIIGESLYKESCTRLRTKK